jgi:hypothetical protein
MLVFCVKVNSRCASLLLHVRCHAGRQSHPYPADVRQVWQDWENRIWSKYATHAPQKRFASELAAELKWLLQQVRALSFVASSYSCLVSSQSAVWLAVGNSTQQDACRQQDERVLPC